MLPKIFTKPNVGLFILWHSHIYNNEATNINVPYALNNCMGLERCYLFSLYVPKHSPNLVSTAFLSRNNGIMDRHFISLTNKHTTKQTN